MEEQKTNTKVVKMNPKNTAKNEAKKYTYEELNNICNQLFQQNKNLVSQLQQLNMGNVFRRLDYLFKVVEYSSAFNDAEFVGSCIEEIKSLIAIPDEKENKESEQ